jgi:hypothetical protein
MFERNSISPIKRHTAIVILKPNPSLLMPGERTGYFPWHILNHRLQSRGLLVRADFLPDKVDDDKLILLFPVTDIVKALPALKDELLYLGLLHMAEIGFDDADTSEGCWRVYYPLSNQPIERHFVRPKDWLPLVMPTMRGLYMFGFGILAGVVATIIHLGVGLALAACAWLLLGYMGTRWLQVRRRFNSQCRK